jgi:hypothetical protein
MKWLDKLLAGAVVTAVVTLTAVSSAHAYIDLLWWLRR